MKITPIILAGGNGSRLWPLSRKNHPKQFLEIKDGINFFQNTVKRVSDNNIFNDPIIICGQSHRWQIEDSLKKININKYHIILEPTSKNTAAPIIAASLFLKEENSKILILPIDHMIKNEDRFINNVVAAVEKGNDFIVTFGIKFNKCNPSFGYLQKGQVIENSNLMKVSKFVEKPENIASEAITSEEYLLNTGILLTSPKTLIDEINLYEIDLLKYVKESLDNAKVNHNVIELEKSNYSNCKSISIDYALLEKSEKLAAFQATFDWADIGSFYSFDNLIHKDANNNSVKGNGIFIDSKNCYINSEKLFTAVISLKDAKIISTKDTVIAFHKNDVAKIRKVYSLLEIEGHNDLIEGNIEYRPWGYYENLVISRGYKIKKIIVNQGGKLSLQSHDFRSEQWTVIKGIATVTIDEKVFQLTKHQSTFIPVKAKHRLENCHDEILEIIEIQIGEKLIESDIHRYEDIYERV
ncbi:mannose-1-phosphate guanylyltransferase/mannose-6-phosphate isomerase [Candidatus Aquarickettsia rohweri]|uniref:mannose-1-phosphate guanylyltransferase n=1 Tax=Candidatus Aquarickettsia rohweri TaxID=2602574 RepID=A0A429XVY4_9RICK|nr:mannose-1-phosphate guanylyltransferase/mannose-6-phosphate isomerase [Candidatus Aquarickettsia rohweri]RST72445.1 mannose-1-phosphate guanylyltransferase/mannose-6-phosphate isomerase [Candidatus Aquarickettsia rohweri]